MKKSMITTKMSLITMKILVVIMKMKMNRKGSHLVLCTTILSTVTPLLQWHRKVHRRHPALWLYNLIWVFLHINTPPLIMSFDSYIMATPIPLIISFNEYFDSMNPLFWAYHFMNISHQHPFLWSTLKVEIRIVNFKRASWSLGDILPYDYI